MDQGLSKDFMAERRKYKRFRVRTGVLGSFKFHWYSPAVLGQIVDMGRGGLTLHHFSAAKKLTGPCTLKIVSADGGFRMDKILSGVVSETEIEKEFEFGSILLRRSGIQFRELTSMQLYLLDYFIENYTTAQLQQERIAPYDMNPADKRNPE